MEFEKHFYRAPIVYWTVCWGADEKNTSTLCGTSLCEVELTGDRWIPCIKGQ